ncbi:MAG: hypothetical protein HOH36_00395 [Acidimicrobiaceae bacterium]|jgi:uncharacterized protein|nr:hypothetical protein [Acidimicrobiaceae bacterium]MBT5580892.1 hypothetical protein [Acidimicrobiaceae bacterium]MBT5848874.1 hypothetical protein [Acidimicrobiaceae bacterium]
MGPARVTTHQFASSDGTILEADVLIPETRVANAVVCHPHPLYGGNRNDAVVTALCQALVEADHEVVRFDFRGAGGSAGSYGGGSAEREDLLAAIDQLSDPLRPLVLAGYSFGADIALTVAPDVLQQWLVVAPVLQVFDSFVAASHEQAKRMIVGAHDQFQPAQNLSAITKTWVNTQVATIEAADHFFRASLGSVSELAINLLLD